MAIEHNYENAVRLFKEINPDLSEAIDKLLAQTKPLGVTLFTDEPDIRVFGEHNSTKAVVELFWRQLFHQPNEIIVQASVCQGDKEYSGTVIDPAMRMTIGYLTNRNNIFLFDRTPKNKLFAVIERDSPPFRREKDLLPTLDQLARASGAEHLYHYTATDPNKERFRYWIDQIF